MRLPWRTRSGYRILTFSSLLEMYLFLSKASYGGNHHPKMHYKFSTSKKQKTKTETETKQKKKNKKISTTNQFNWTSLCGVTCLTVSQMWHQRLPCSCTDFKAQADSPLSLLTPAETIPSTFHPLPPRRTRCMLQGDKKTSKTPLTVGDLLHSLYHISSIVTNVFMPYSFLCHVYSRYFYTMSIS